MTMNWLHSRLQTAAILMTAGFLIALPVMHSSAAEPVRVMSFNIRFGTARDGDDAWENRRELVAETIKYFSPDLLGTQETLPFQADYLGKQLPDYEYIGWSRDASPDGEQCGIFYRRDRFEKIEAGQFWLSATPDEKFSKSWDSSLPRVATWVKLQDKQVDGTKLLFVNTHFDHRGQDARLRSGELLHQRITALRNNQPVILTGDFNCAEASEPYRALTSDKVLLDTFRVIHDAASDNEGTFHGFSGKPGEARIDWVLVSPEWMVQSADIDRHHSNDRYPSDHFPVTAVLQLD